MFLKVQEYRIFELRAHCHSAIIATVVSGNDDRKKPCQGQLSDWLVIKLLSFDWSDMSGN